MTGRHKHSQSNNQLNNQSNNQKQKQAVSQSTRDSNHGSDKPSTTQSGSQSNSPSNNFSDTSKRDEVEQKHDASVNQTNDVSSIQPIKPAGWGSGPSLAARLAAKPLTATVPIKPLINPAVAAIVKVSINQPNKRSLKQPIKQPIIQSNNPSRKQSLSQSPPDHFPVLGSSPVIAPINQPTNKVVNKQSLKHPLNQPINQPVSQTANQSRKQSLSQAPVDHFPTLASIAVNQASQPIIQPVAPIWPARTSLSSPPQSINQLTKQNQSQSTTHSRQPSDNPPVSQSINQSNQPVSKSINQSIKQQTNQPNSRPLVRTSSNESTESNSFTPQSGPSRPSVKKPTDQSSNKPDKLSYTQTINQPNKLSSKQATTPPAVQTNKQRKKVHYELIESLRKQVSELETNQRLEVEALQSFFLSDLQVLNSVPSHSSSQSISQSAGQLARSGSQSIKQSTDELDVPTHIRVTVLPEPMLDREKENHVTVVIDIEYPDIDQLIQQAINESSSQSIRQSNNQPINEMSTPSINQPNKQSDKRLNNQTGTKQSPRQSIKQIDVQHQPIKQIDIQSINQINIPPPQVTAYNVKGLSADELLELNQSINQELKKLFAADHRNDGGNMLSLLMDIQPMLQKKNEIISKLQQNSEYYTSNSELYEHFSFHEQMQKRNAELELFRQNEEKKTELERRLKDEEQRKHLAKLVHEANKKKQQIAWQEEKVKKQSINQPNHQLLIGSPSFPPRASADSHLMAPSRPNNQEMNLSIKQSSKLSSASAPSSPLPSERSNKSSSHQSSKKSKREEKKQSNVRAAARKQKEERQTDELYRSISEPIDPPIKSRDQSSDESSSAESSDVESSDQSSEASSDEDIENLFPSPLMLGGLSFFDQKRQNELALLAELDHGHVSSAKNTPNKRSRSLRRGSGSSRSDRSVNRSNNLSDESDDDDSDQESESDDEDDRAKRVRAVDRRQSEASVTSIPPLPPSSVFSRYHHDFDVLQLLGRGGFGAVYKVRNRVDKLLYAVKVIRLKSSSQSINQLIREVSTIAMLHHSFICRYYASWLEAADASQGSSADLIDGSADEQDGWFSSSYASHSQFNPVSMIGDDDVYDSSESDLRTSSHSRNQTSNHANNHSKSSISQFLYIQMEFYPNKTLKDFITDGSAFQSPDLCWRLLRQMFEAVAYIHSKNIVHRDLKPANVFIDQNQNVKIGDFGLAVLMQEHGENMTDEQKSLSNGQIVDQIPSPNDALSLMSRESSLREVVGTVFYRSPEQEQEGERYDEKADIWALGVIAFELFHKFDSMSERAHVLTELRRTSRVPADFMMKSLANSPTNNQTSNQTNNQTVNQANNQPNNSAFNADRDRVVQLIHWLLLPSSNDRPSASDVLKSGLVPLKIEDEYLALSIKMLTDQKSVHYGQLLENLFSGENDPLIDWTFDYLSQAQSTAMSYQLSVGQVRQSTPLPLASLQMFQQRVFDSLERVFQLHGATHFATPLIHPKTQNNSMEGKANQVVLLDSAGILVKLPYSLTVPFARFVAQSAASSMDPSRFDDRSHRASRWLRNSLLVGGESVAMDWRRYDIAKVYRRNPAGGRPREVFECDFDIVWPDSVDSRASVHVSPATTSGDRSPSNDMRREVESYEYDKRVSIVAECISITLDALALYHYAIGPVLVCINHLALLELVIDRMILSLSSKSSARQSSGKTNDLTSSSLSEDALRATLYRAASQYAVTSLPFHRSAVRKQMVSEAVWSTKVIDWFGSCLSLRCGHLDVEKLSERVHELLLTNHSPIAHIATVERSLAEIRSLYECLKALGVAEYAVFNLGLVSKRDLYNGMLTFQAFIHAGGAAVHGSSGNHDTLLLEPIAVGGCYDSLLNVFAPPSSDSIMHGCGINLAIEKLVHSVINCHIRARCERTFPPLSPFLMCSSLHAPQTVTIRKHKRSAVTSAPTIAPIFASPSSSLVPSSMFPLVPTCVVGTSVLLFSPRHHLLRERLTLASVFWSSGVACHFSLPYTVTLSALFAYMKLHSHRYLVLMRRRIWRDRGTVEMIDVSTIPNQRRWDKLVTGLKQSEHAAGDDNRLLEGVDAVLASEALTWLRNRGALGHEQNNNAAHVNAVAVPAVTSGSTEMHVQLIDPHSSIKKDQKPSLIAAVRRCVAPFASSPSLERASFALAVDLPLHCLRAFTTAYLTYHASINHHSSHHSHHKSHPRREERREEELPTAMSEQLSTSVPAKHRDALVVMYAFIWKRCELTRTNGDDEQLYCFLYSISDRKCDILQCL